MNHLEFHEDGRILIVSSESISTDSQIDEVRRLMKANGIHRAILADIFSDPSVPDDEAAKDYENTLWFSYLLHCNLLIPHVSSRLAGPDGCMFAYLLISSGVPFFAFDRPRLTRNLLVREIERTGKPLDREQLQAALRDAVASKRQGRSLQIRMGMKFAKESGVRFGNPRIKEAQEKARAQLQATRPSTDTLRLMASLRQEAKSLRQIASILNERGVPTPRGKQWYAKSVSNYLGQNS
jgi:hypothetical protein